MFAIRWVGALVAVVLLAGCTLPAARSILGSGKTVTLEFDFDDFTQVNVSNAFRVDITQADGYSIQVEVDDNLEPYLEVKRVGDELQIGLKPRLNILFGNTTLRAWVTMPQLTGLEVSGASRCDIAGFESDKRLNLEASGASTVRGDITSGTARIEASGASTVELTGAGSDLDAIASGASTLRLDDFVVLDARADASGASRITVNLSGTLDATASGASSVRYLGDPARVKRNSSGASSIEPK